MWIFGKNRTGSHLPMMILGLPVFPRGRDSGHIFCKDPFGPREPPQCLLPALGHPGKMFIGQREGVPLTKAHQVQV